jgi:four helix bundle protein
MSYRDLEVYKRSFRLGLEIYKYSLTIPKEFQYDLADQIRRASRSIPSNIAEGFGRNKSSKDKINFLNDSLGSNDEMLFNLDFLFQTGLLDEEKYNEWKSEYTICGKQLYQLIQSLLPVTSNL